MKQIKQTNKQPRNDHKETLRIRKCQVTIDGCKTIGDKRNERKNKTKDAKKDAEQMKIDIYKTTSNDPRLRKKRHKGARK